MVVDARAQDASWLANPGSGAFNDDANWSVGTVPTGTATFGTSTITTIGIGASTDVGSLTFGAGSPAYAFIANGAGSVVRLTGSGIVNNSANVPSVSIGGTTDFRFENAASAGNAAINVASGFLRFNASSTAGTSTVQVGAGGSVLFSDDASGGQSRFIVGSGGIFDISSNTSGGVSVGSIEGEGTFNLGNGRQLLVGSNNLSTTVDGVVSGPGSSLVKTGTGTLTLGGSNSFSGGAAVIGGTLAVSRDDNLGDVAGSIGLDGGTLRTTASFATNRGLGLGGGGGSLQVDDGTTLTWAGNINGGGSLTKAGNGTLTLDGANTYSGGTTVSAGALVGTTTSLQGNIVNNATTIFQQAGSGLYAGTISGSGNVEVDAPGSIVAFTGDSSYTGTTTVRDTTFLQIGNQGTTGSLGSGTIFLSNSHIAFARTDDIVVANTITGTGGVILAASGTVTLTGTNTFTGGMDLGGGGTVAAAADTNLGGGGELNFLSGTLKFLSSFNLGAGRAIDVRSTGGTIDTNGFDTTIAQGITGVGPLTKAGLGTLTLSGANTLTGQVTVGGGLLVLNGSVAGNLLVNAAGTLGGTGTVGGNLTVNGTVSPGNSIGTLTVNGNYNQGASGIYAVEVNGAGQADRVAVGGNIALSGGVVSVRPEAGSYRRTTTYTILGTTNGILTGTFTDVTSNNFRLVPTLTYSGKAVTLSLLNLDTTYTSAGYNANQNAAGNVLNLTNASATGDFGNVLNAISTLDQTSRGRVLDAIGGQSYSGFSSLAVQGILSFLNGFSLNAGSGSDGNGNQVALAEACDVACDVVAPRWRAWGAGLGAFGTVAGDANASGTTYSLGGFAAGLGRQINDSLLVGVTVGFNAASLYSQDIPGRGTSNTLQFGLYGQAKQGPAYLDALAGYAHGDNRMSRPIAIPGLPYRVAQGQAPADMFFGQLEAGYKVELDRGIGAFVTPFARLQAATSTQAAFTESGADSLNLSVSSRATQTLRTVLGAQLGASMETGWRDKLDVRFSLGWSHEFADRNRPVSAAFAGAPALVFTTYGAPAPSDGVVLSFGAGTSIAEATKIFFRYDGDLAGANTNHTLSAGLKYVW
jgi:outer membrane autotransporter protein